MIYTVGLTGGIGSGKSTASQYFAQLGVPIIDADVIARELVAKGQDALDKIVAHFGPSVLQNDLELNRHLLREKIFHSPVDKKWLEDLLHPLIDKTIVTKIKQISSPYCIVVIPLLAEHYPRYHSLLDEIVVIDTKADNQLNWASERDPSNKLLIQKMVATQTSSESRLKIADHVIENNGTREELKNKVRSLHQIFIAKFH